MVLLDITGSMKAQLPSHTVGINRRLDSSWVCGWQRRHLTLTEESWDAVTKGDVLIAIRQITLIYTVTEPPSAAPHLPQEHTPDFFCATAS